MKSFFSSRVLKFSSLMCICALGLTTFSLPMTAIAEEACVRTSAGNVVCGTLVPKSSSSSNRTDSEETIQTQVDPAGYGGDYSVTWELKSCSRIKKNVKCTFLISNNVNRSYGLWLGPTKMVDSGGNEYLSSFIKSGTRSASADGNTTTGIYIDMAKGINYKVFIDFTGVPSSTSQVALLKISNSGGSGVSFRDVPIN